MVKIIDLTFGQYYEGETKNDLPDGFGIHYFPDGSRVEGEFKDGLLHERGKWINADGDYAEVVWTGIGNQWRYKFITRTVPSLKNYEGDLENGKRNGYGTQYYPFTGARYEGEWKDDLKSGKGIMYYNNGRYEGEWENDAENGQGIRYYNDGKRYEGEMKSGMYHGLGTLYYASGRKKRGIWHHGNYVRKE